MKTIFDYKKDLVFVDKPEEQLERFFIKLSDLISSFSIDINNIKISKSRCNPVVHSSDFERIFLEEFIKSSLNIPNNEIWSKVFKITKNSYSDHYGKYITIYDMIIESKVNLVRELNGEWVYINYKLVEEFLSKNNDLYNKLLKIKKLFPCQIM